MKGSDGLAKFRRIHAIRHILTPGTPVYGILKLGSVVLLFALFAMRGRSGHAAPAEPSAAETPAPRRPHPVSKKKRRSRKRRS